jgi:lipopolysaccharide/colanic/teichoic acid biosynthesis glycosyltransferase
LSTQARQPVPWYEHTDIGYNYRMSNVLAALGRGQLTRLDDMIARRREIRQSYVSGLSDIEGVRFLGRDRGGDDSRDNCWLTAIVLDPAATPVTADALIKALGDADIEARHLWKPMHAQPVFAQARAFINGTSDRLFAQGVTLPSGSVLTDAEVQTVLSATRLRLGRPVLFRQQRPGLHNQPFDMLKFRTMLPVDPTKGQISDASRMTPLGGVLRSSSLDELPTLWNIVRGDMSLVGPRPLLMQYLERYSPEQARRHETKPGLTGLAQVSGRNALTWEEKFRHDVDYVDTQSLGLDLRIIARTVLSVIRRDGISAAGEATMPEFRGGTEHTMTSA